MPIRKYWGIHPLPLPLFLALVCCCFTAQTSVSLAITSTTVNKMTSTTSTKTKTDVIAEALAPTATSFASAHGLLIASSNSENTNTFQGAPISLLPNAFPTHAFKQAQELAPAFNLLVDRISCNAPFLKRTLAGAAHADDFTRRLLELYVSIYDNENDSNENTSAATSSNKFATSADRLGILRSDYMLQQQQGDESSLLSDGSTTTCTTTTTTSIKQIELNTIASSFASLACQVSRLHAFLLARNADFVELQEFLKSATQAVRESTTTATTTATMTTGSVPDNMALENLADAMALAMQRYQERFFHTNNKAVILFVVQPNETNTVDQRLLEFQLWRAHGCAVVRKSLAEIATSVTVDATDGRLLLNCSNNNNNGANLLEIGLVYFRAGYAPADYPSDAEWQARAFLEQSRATKCPCLGYHLAGTKKVQQELARPAVLEQFFGVEEQAVAVQLRAAFAGLYSLGDDAVEDDFCAVRDALSGNHDKYVLKPQREGGGYNFYGIDLKKKLQEHVVRKDDVVTLDKKLGEYILMERLFPPQQQAILLRSGRVEGTGMSVSELGCYGTILVDADGHVVSNAYAGYLLRTKFENVNEGGVASGFATLSSPYLC
jgi:glutathione synthetase